MSDGKYCEQGKKFEDIRESRERWHKDRTEINKAIASTENELKNIKEELEDIKESLGKKLNQWIFIFTFGTLIGFLGWVALSITDLKVEISAIATKLEFVEFITNE